MSEELNPDRYILVKHKDGKVTRLYERNGVTSCEIENRQNDESALTITMLKTSPKCADIMQPENIFVANGREYVPIKSDTSITEEQDNTGKITVTINAVESYYLLKKKFVTAYNSITNYDHIDKHMVVVLSNGALGLNVNGVSVSNPYTKGSAAYALYAVLYGSGWSVGTVDVEGTYDLETDKLNVLENVLKIQEIWGGIFLWDSANKTVSLRDTEKYKPYHGFQIRYGKNIKNITANISTDLVTRLYVYGKDNLNIASDNNGLEYIDDFRYTNSIYEGILYNTDISDQRELKNWGIKQIVKLCQPQITIETNIVDLREFKGYTQETFQTNDIVDVINDDVLDGKVYQARLIYWKYDFFHMYKCTLEVGDEQEKFVDKFKYALDNSNYVAKTYSSSTGSISSNSINLAGTTSNLTKTNATNVSNITANKTNINDLYAKNITVTNLVATKASIADLNVTNQLVATKASITDLNATNATITNLKATVANIDTLVARKADISDLTATNATISNLKATVASIDSLTTQKFSAVNGNITNLTSKVANVQTLVASKANITDLNVTNGYITNLYTRMATINTLVASKASISQLEAVTARVNMLVSSSAVLTPGSVNCNTLYANSFTLGGSRVKGARVLGADGKTVHFVLAYS